ncbi:serine/threonine-protein kinase RIO3 [Anthonomus grandis grandis]|uniref:serine/threonine-protein kinase RIO3 n=1 Tax=Anthonomus grandis grandis TaxID=2921223 RepID=UPI0021657219|nr:serine/threonine-protein kinase RIO3 [Anthonomus grandis grandis]
MSCPWAKIDKPQPVDFAEIMSEEVAKDLQEKENKKVQGTLNSVLQEAACSPIVHDIQVIDDIPEDVLKAISNDSLESDALIAQMLQMQFDKEYDNMLTKTEQKYNGSSKVSVSFENYRRAPQNFDFESDLEEDEIEDILDRKDWDRFDALMRDIGSMPMCGYKVKQNGEMVTKHDLDNSGRKNACKLLSFPPEFQTGDGENFDLKLSNKVFNSLKRHSNKEQIRRHKVQDKKEDQATAEFGMDAATRLYIYKMINAQLLKQVNGVISIGKEAVILHADTDEDFPDAKISLPKECAIKVFKTTLSEYKQRDKYIKDDHRFKDRVGKQTSKKTIHLWAEKEMANLMRLKRAGLNCPEVINLKKHVLVMSFIGQNHVPAPKLKDAFMSDADYIDAYEQVIGSMKTLYLEANLIHADLSEYNILWHNDMCYFIDVSQSVEPSHENAFHFLYRDCCNVINFFTKKNVSKILTPEELFEQIVGHPFADKIALMALQESFKMKPHLIDKPGIESSFEFETAWEKAQSGELPLMTGSSSNKEKVVERVISSTEELTLTPQA